MILSRSEIIESVKRGKIAFTPKLQEVQWGEASVDLRMGYQLTKIVGTMA